LKNYEKKSFFITVILFFIPLFVLSSTVLFMYHEEQIEDMEKNILYKMKDYSYDFKGKDFILDIVDYDEKKVLFTIHHVDNSVSAYFETPSKKALYLLKISYEKAKYIHEYDKLVNKTVEIAGFSFFLLLFLSLAFSLYSLKPMKQAINLLEDFLKDLIHDLNTPATSILLNTRLLKRHGDFEELERIELCAKDIASLYKNLELMTPSSMKNDENVDIVELVEKKVNLLEKIYPNIIFVQSIEDNIVIGNKNAMERIVDNLLTNACKYNVKNGKVNIDFINNILLIKDTGIGIKDTSKVFQRYYKENKTGLGIGLNIVKQLCEILDIKISIKSTMNKGTEVKLLFKKKV